MLTTNTDKHWQRWGEQDPYYGVLSVDEFRAQNLNEQSKEAFFQSGERHVEFCISEIEQYLDPDFHPRRCLDFGCGVGRVLIPMARRFEHVVGVDISKSMIREALDNCREREVENVEFAESDAELTQVRGRYDFIHSYIVLQHIPQNRGLKLVGRMLELLNDDGICALHFCYLRNTSLTHRSLNWMQKKIPLVHNVRNWILGKPFNCPDMQMNDYRLNEVFDMLEKYGFGRIHVRLMKTTQHGTGTLFLFCQKQAANTPLTLSHRKKQDPLE